MCHFRSKIHSHVHNPPCTCPPEYLEKRQYVFGVMPHRHSASITFLTIFIRLVEEKNVSKMFAILRENNVSFRHVIERSYDRDGQLLVG